LAAAFWATPDVLIHSSSKRDLTSLLLERENEWCAADREREREGDERERQNNNKAEKVKEKDE